MSGAIALGLLAALFYGSADFAARFAGRRVGPLRTIFHGHAAAALAGGCMLLWLGLPRADPAIWALAVVSNVTGLAATALLYRALTIGALGVVSPIVATYGAIAAILSGLSGERLSFVAWAGLALASAGAMLVARPRPAERKNPALDPGLVPAIGASLCYGVSFWLLGRFVVPHLGPFPSVYVYYVCGVAGTLAFASLTRRPLSPPARADVPLVYGVTALGIAGTLALAIGQASGSTSVVTVLSALASAVTVLLARAVLKEPVPLAGWAGLLLTVAGLGILQAR